MGNIAHCVYILGSSACLYKIYIINKVSTESRLLISAFYYIITLCNLRKNSWRSVEQSFILPSRWASYPSHTFLHLLKHHAVWFIGLFPQKFLFPQKKIIISWYCYPCGDIWSTLCREYQDTHNENDYDHLFSMTKLILSTYVTFSCIIELQCHQTGCSLLS